MSPKNSQEIVVSDYNQLLAKVVERIEQTKVKVLASANTHLIELYWNIGRIIVEEQEKKGWGKAVVERLSQDLRFKYPKINGFSTANLWRMRQFCLEYQQDTILSTLLRELSWSSHILLLTKVKGEQERRFYLEQAVQNRWSCRQLERQIDAALFDRTIFTKDSKTVLSCLPTSATMDLSEHFKEEYVLEFLDLSSQHTEKELRKAILANLRDFFLEFGRNFSFVGEEYCITVEGQDFRIDLLFFHRSLRSLVAVELKIGPFKPEYLGKMQFYLGALDEMVRLKDENESIGIILCRSKEKGIVEFAMSKNCAPIKVATYKTALPQKELIERRLEQIKLPEEYEA